MRSHACIFMYSVWVCGLTFAPWKLGSIEVTQAHTMRPLLLNQHWLNVLLPFTYVYTLSMRRRILLLGTLWTLICTLLRCFQTKQHKDIWHVHCVGGHRRQSIAQNRPIKKWNSSARLPQLSLCSNNRSITIIETCCLLVLQTNTCLSRTQQHIAHDARSNRNFNTKATPFFYCWWLFWKRLWTCRKVIVRATVTQAKRLE